MRNNLRYKNLIRLKTFFLLCVLFLSSNAGIKSQTEQTQRILVINSYHVGFTWTDDIVRGIGETFQHEYPCCELVYEFMDARRLYSATYFNVFREFLKLKYRNRKIDLVICSDDHAFRFFLQWHNDLFPGVPSVFLSVSGFEPTILEGKEITGIVERLDIRKTLEIALHNHPNTRKVSVITDKTLTGQTLKRKAINAFEPFEKQLRLEFIEDLTIDDLENAVSEMDEETIIFLFIFSKDEKDIVFSHEENLDRLYKHSSRPIYSVWDFYLGHGIVGGKLMSGYYDGQKAARLAIRILRGENASEIDPVFSQNQYMFDYELMDRFNIEQTNIPENSIIINRQISFFQKYRSYILFAIALIIVESFIIILLYINTQKRKKAESKLRDNEENLSVTLQSIGDAVIVTNTTGVVTQMNPIAEKLCGYRFNHQKQVLLNDIFKIFDSRTGEQAENPVENVLKNGLIIGLANDTELHSLDGNVYQIADSAAPIRKDNNEIIGVVLVFSDVTQKYKTENTLKESELRWHFALEGSEAGVWDWNVSTGDVFFSSRWKSMLGYRNNEISNSLEEWDKRIHPEDRDKAYADIKKHMDGEVPVYINEHRLKCKDGSYKWILDRGKVIEYTEDKKPHRMIGTHTDISDRKEAENELRKAKNKAEESDRLKSAFLANMSHEIRTPMNSILGFSELLREKSDDEKAREKYINIINQKGNHLLQIINDIIDISKIEAGQLNIKKHNFNLNELINDLFETYRAELNSNDKDSIELIPHYVLPKNYSEIFSDRTRLYQILSNLLSNAVKFTEKGSIEFGYTIKDKKYLEFFVKDTGIGIPKDKLNTIFERFTQSFQKGKKLYGGTGLGLAVCKGLVELLDGRIWVESAEEKGSAFYFSIEFENVLSKEESAKKAVTIKTASWKGKKILLVEDDEFSIAYFSEIIKKTGAELIIATDGKKALELFSDGNNIDLVLLDIQLPEMDGYEVAQKIRKSNKNIPIIAQTAYAMIEDKQKSIEAGCNDYITKPIRKADFISLSSKYLFPNTS